MDIIQKDALAPPPTEALEMAEALCGDNTAVLGVLFYGSGLWKAVEEDTVLDFYLIVNSFTAYKSPLSHRFWGALLPPNVYYTEHTANGKTLRAKYAVMTYWQFKAAAHGIAIAPSIWARFSQPCRLFLTKNAQTESKLLAVLTAANTTFHKRTLPLLKPQAPITPEVLWQTGLAETYRSELRSEKKGRNHSIYAAQKQSFDARTALFSQTHPGYLKEESGVFRPQTSCFRRLIVWLNTPFRRSGGKCVTLLRLIKAPLTFTGAVDYILWKLERHSGTRLYATEFQRKHPLIGAWPLLFRVLKDKIAK